MKQLIKWVRHVLFGSSPLINRRLTVTDRQNKITIMSEELDGSLYSSQLLSFSLDRLKKEPKLLAEEELRLQRALQTTATTHYDAFIKTASCLQTIDTELQSVCGHLDHLLQVSVMLANRMKFERTVACILVANVLSVQV